MSTPTASTAIVADDHGLLRASLAELLRRDLGFTIVVEAESLDQMIEHLGRIPDVRLATVDLAMPGMVGATSLQAIRDVYPNVRVAMISGSERREDILLALAAGAHGYITKTLSMADISAALRTIVAGNIYVPPALAARAIPSATAPSSQLSSDPSAGRSRLSPRQQVVAELLAAGKSNKEIARDLSLAEGTVKVHIQAILRAFGAHNRVSALAAMARQGAAQSPDWRPAGGVELGRPNDPRRS